MSYIRKIVINDTIPINIRALRFNHSGFIKFERIYPGDCNFLMQKS